MVAALPVALDPANLAWVSGVIGFLLPNGIALLNQTHWPTKLKSFVAFVVCIIVAVITTWIKGDVNFTDLVGSAGIIYTVAMASYTGLWKPTEIAPTIEAKTTVTSPTTP